MVYSYSQVFVSSSGISERWNFKNFKNVPQALKKGHCLRLFEADKLHCTMVVRSDIVEDIKTRSLYYFLECIADGYS